MSLLIRSAIVIWPFIACAHAQEGGLPLWEAGLVGGAYVSPAYPGSTERLSVATALPYLIYRGNVLRIDRKGLEARLVHQDNFEVDIGLAGSLPASSKDIAVRAGMADLGTLLEFGPRARWVVARPTPTSRIQVELPLRQVLEFNGGIHGQGVVFEPRLSYETRDWGDGWRGSVSASLVFGDRRLNEYFYSVPSEFVTTFRPAYEAKAGLLASRITVDSAKNLTPDVRVFGFFRYDNYEGAANSSSPLMQRSNGISSGVVLAWIWGRSSLMSER